MSDKRKISGKTLSYPDDPVSRDRLPTNRSSYIKGLIKSIEIKDAEIRRLTDIVSSRETPWPIESKQQLEATIALAINVLKGGK